MTERGEQEPLLSRDSSTRTVEFQEDDDGNPQQWSSRYRWFSVALLCLNAAVVTYTCVGIVPVADDVVRELKGHKDRLATVLFVTIWELGEATGPLFLAPLSELYGRFIVLNVANCFFITGVVITAVSQNAGLLIFSRFATGCAVAANVLNPAIIGDMFPSESRGSAMSAVMLAPLIGGALGPTISGSLADAIGWRGIMWICVGVASAIEIVVMALFRETYHPTILRRRAAKKRRETGDDSYQSEQEQQDRGAGASLLRSMSRPAQIFWSSSLLQCLSIWSGVMFAFFYVNSTSLPEILDVIYGFDPAKRGLSYLAWSLGSVIGITTCNRGMDKIYNYYTKRRGTFYPEGRLPLSITGAFLLPVSVLLYGWTAELHTNVFAYLATVTLLCISVVFSIVPLMTFITDAFGAWSASALTAVLVTRCLLGAGLPLLVPAMAEKVGYGWAFTVLAALALVLAPIPCLAMRYGPSWRQRSTYTRNE